MHVFKSSYNSMMSSSTTIALLYTLCLHFLAFSCVLFSSLFYMPFTLLSSFSLCFKALMTYHSLFVTFTMYCFFSLCFLFIYKNIHFFSNSTLTSYLCVLQVFLWHVFRKYVLQFLLPTPTPTVSLKQQFLLQPKNYWLRPAVCHKIFYMTSMLCPSSSISCRLLKIFFNILILKSINFRVIRRKGLCNYSM